MEHLKMRDLMSTSSSTVLGFTLTGNTISPSNDVLTTISFNSSSDEICLSDVILSDPLGVAVEVEVENVLMVLAVQMHQHVIMIPQQV